MKEIIELIQKIDSDYKDVDTSFHSGLEERNKASLDHLGNLKAIKGLIDELKKNLVNDISNLDQQKAIKTADFDSHAKSLSEALSSQESKIKENEKVLVNQQQAINENGSKIRKTEDSITVIRQEKDIAHSQYLQVHEKLILEERLLKQNQVENTILDNKISVLKESIGLLTSQEDDFKKSIREKSEIVSNLEKRITQLNK